MLLKDKIFFIFNENSRKTKLKFTPILSAKCGWGHVTSISSLFSSQSNARIDDLSTVSQIDPFTEKKEAKSKEKTLKASKDINH